MYQRVYNLISERLLSNFKSHLEQLVARYSVVVPGCYVFGRTAVCLSFDDATYDFYH